MLLNYIQNSIDENVTDKANGEFYQYVEAVKILPEVRQNYMTFEEYMYYREHDAKMEGKLEGRLEGRLQGRLEGRLQGRLEEKLENYGEDISNALRERISSETDVEILKSWLKIAARCDSIAEFCNAAQLHPERH